MLKSFLRKHRKETYSTVLPRSKFYDHLQEIDELAHDFISRMVSELAAHEGAGELLKASNQMEWVRRMNEIKVQAEEIVLRELICG